MKILVTYLPIKGKDNRIPTLGGNRQYAEFYNPTFIFPPIMMSLYTLLKKNSFTVYYKDAIAEGISQEEYLDYFEKLKPDIVLTETKTPTIQRTWDILKKMKELHNSEFYIVGEHPTLKAEESEKRGFKVIKGGDYDIEFYKILTGKEIKHLDELPFPTREFNYLYQKEYNLKPPYAYIYSSHDCYWGKCTFCVWNRCLYPNYRTRSVKNVLDEIGELIEQGYKEIFNDAGSHPAGKWLIKFCKGMIERGYNKKVKYSCNFRFSAINEENAKLMKEARFRLLKFGLESGSQERLNKINKGITIEQIKEGCRLAYKNGLIPHITCMYGYLDETKEEAQKTYELVKEMMLKYACIMQATIVQPYLGTEMYEEAKEKNGFIIDLEDWEKFDMSQQVLRSEINAKEWCDKTYKIYFHPKYILKALYKYRNISFLKKGLKAVLGHLKRWH